MTLHDFSDLARGAWMDDPAPQPRAWHVELRSASARFTCHVVAATPDEARQAALRRHVGDRAWVTDVGADRS